MSTFFSLFAKKAPQINPPIPAPNMITSYFDFIWDLFEGKSFKEIAIVGYEYLEMIMDEMLPVSEKAFTRTFFTSNSLFLLDT